MRNTDSLSRFEASGADSGDRYEMEAGIPLREEPGQRALAQRRPRTAVELPHSLRRERLYSSHLITWRRQREQDRIAGLEPLRRGPKPAPRNLLSGEVARLQRDSDRLQKRLRQAETIIGVQNSCARCWATVDEDGNVK